MSATRRRTSKPGENFWFCFWLLAFLLLVYLGIRHRLNREPIYQGRTLTEWLGEMRTNYYQDDVRRQAEEHAVRTMGEKCVPRLIKILKMSLVTQALDEVFRSAETDLKPLSALLDTEIRLPDEVDYSEEAKRAFAILGRQGKSAIPYFNSVFQNPNKFRDGAELLSLLGPVAIPTLTNVFQGTNQDAEWYALCALGQIGLSASNAFGLVTNLLDVTNEFVSFRAVTVLGEMGDLAQPFVPRLEKMLFDTNYCKAAAYSLARLGKLRPLGIALTNAHPYIQSAALNGLVYYTQKREPADLSYFFNKVPRGPSSYVGAYHPGWALIARLATNLASPDPILRELVAGALGQYKVNAWAAVPALSNALSDEDPLVRKKAAESLKAIDVTLEEGGIVRGPRKEKKIALEFSGHAFADGGETILNELEKRHARASFFLTGDFVENPDLTNTFRRMVAKGHYVGPHSDKHLLYCACEGAKKTLVTSNAFRADLRTNSLKISDASLFISVESSKAAELPISSVLIRRGRMGNSRDYWLPPFERYNQEIANWSDRMGMVLVNHTPGTLSQADDTQESDTNFVSSQAIFDSIVKKEREDPDGLNGFLLLFHLGSGPGRTDKFSARFGELLDYLSARGYQFVRIDEMMEGR